MRPRAAILVCLVVLLASVRIASPVRAQEEAPAIGAAAGSWSLYSPSIIPPWTCPSTKNRATYGAEGFDLRVTGRCRDASQVAGITVATRSIEFADGEVSIDVRVPTGHARARLFLYARLDPERDRSYYMLWDPGRGIAEIRKSYDATRSVGLVRRDDAPVVPVGHWSRVAFVLAGPRLWMKIDGQTILAANDEEFDVGGIAFGMSRLGSLDGDAEVVSTWRELQVAPLADGSAARAPRLPGAAPRVPPAAPPAQSIVARPTPMNVVVQDDMRTPSLFWPRSCTTGNNVGTHGADGLRLSITGPCSERSRAATAEASQPDTTIGDGEGRLEFRVDQGWERARISMLLVDAGTGRLSLVASVHPASGSVELYALTSEGAKQLATGRHRGTVLQPDTWTAMAVQRVGNRVWVMIGDAPVLAAEGAPTVPGIVLASINRLGPIDDSPEVVVTLRDFTASTVVGGDPERGVARAPRPVRDPSFDRILAFIRSDLVDDPGTDAAAAERRAIGTAILEMLEATNVNLEVAPLPGMSVARFGPFRRSVQVDERLMSYTPHVATMLLTHELVHAHQERVGYVRGCFERELDAVKWQNRLWRAWFGPGGKNPPGDDVESLFTNRLRLEEIGRLEEAVRAVYKEQCDAM